MINNREVVAVELRRQHFFCQRHTYGIGDTLAQWTCGGFNTRCIAILWVTRCFRVQLAELL